MTRILVVDNHDSFVHTLIGYLQQLGADVTIVEADALDVDGIDDLVASWDGVMISPGPGTPERAGASIAVVTACAATQTPLLGVCLGHQAIAVAFGAHVSHAPELKHGMVSAITHDGASVFAGLASPVNVGRYHSLAIVADSLPAELTVTARTSTGVIMAVQHRALPIHGVQFHPESVLTDHGYDMLATWLADTGLAGASERARLLSPLGSASATRFRG